MNKTIIILSLFSILLLAAGGCSGERKEVRVRKTAEAKSEKKGYEYSKRYIAAIFSPENKTQREEFDQIVHKSAGALIPVLISSEKVRVIEREKIESMLEENKLTLAGMTQNQAAYELGKLLNAEVLIFTDITKAFYTEDGNTMERVESKVQTMEVKVEVRAVLLKTGEILAAVTGEGREKNGYNITGTIKNGERKDDKKLFEKAYEKAIDDAAEKLAQKMPEKITIDIKEQ